MTAFPRPTYHPGMEQPSCAWCRCFPCVCQREESCVCGGTVLADDGAIGEAVRAHQRTAKHRVWRQERGL